jgi:hypothetical protein
MSKQKNLTGIAGRTAALSRKHRPAGVQSALLSGLLGKLPCAPVPDAEGRSSAEAQVESRSTTQTCGQSNNKAEF